MKIAGYTRISVDLEINQENTSIENQKSIISDYVDKNFPKDELIFFEDRDRSGYTFEQRESYQEMRSRLMSGEIEILIVKDFSRFARRNSKGLVELEDLRDAGVRIISIGDAIDYPTHDEWMQIQFRFLINEMPVTDTSKKVRSVIKRRQEEGKWINIVPYGYVIENAKKQLFSVVPDEAEVIKKIYELYTDEGWGYKKIANYLTERGIPTPRMKEKERIEARGDVCNRKFKTSWSIITIQEILDNDFYAGTLRQRKYVRKNINGADKKLSKEENIVFENHHEPIIEMKYWMRTQFLKEQRSKNHYRGVKKYPNVYSGLLVCGDCGEPMFSMSRGDLAAAYVCSSYHKRGLKGCTSHHTRVDFLDAVIKEYLMLVRDNSEEIIEDLEKRLKNEATEVKENDNTLSYISNLLDVAKQELKTLKTRKIKEITRLEIAGKTKDDIDLIEETYQEIEDELILRISGLQEQLSSVADKRNDIIRINRMARTVIDVFNDIINKDNLDKTDLQLIVEKIIVYNDRLDIQLKADIDSLLHLQNNKVDCINFNQDSKVILNKGLILEGKINPNTTSFVRMAIKNHPERLFTVNVISSGDPLEIFTDREGEIILKKYSPIGEMTTFAKQYAESLAQVSGKTALIADRDQFIAVAGGYKSLLGKAMSREMEDAITNRESIMAVKGDKKFIDISDEKTPEMEQFASVPIIAEGDVIGVVILASNDATDKMGEVERKLVQSAAGFLGRQMEQ